MNAAVWCIAADTPLYEAHDLGGQGAELHGGRWNRPGHTVVYAAGTIALACLETMAHLNQAGLPLRRFLVRIDLPSAVWAQRQVLTADALPSGWAAFPESKVSLDIGDTWLKSASSAVLLVPSVVVHEEANVLINTKHPDAAQIRATKVRPWLYDAGVRQTS